jgi:L-fucose mutarotase|tara:strand:+ start:6792 stop:7244 length:453 start_codon:yes stop_codon:yes gene_type:complete
MLIKIDPILSPDILHVLRSMGHGDRLVLCDSNFPAYSTNDNVLRLDGVDIARASKAILSVFPLDSFIPSPVQRMEIDGKPDEINEVHQELINVVKEVSGSHWKISSIERQKFYEVASEAFAVITTNETRPFGCFIFTKGVIKPDGSVWKL